MVNGGYARKSLAPLLTNESTETTLTPETGRLCGPGPGGKDDETVLVVDGGAGGGPGDAGRAALRGMQAAGGAGDGAAGGRALVMTLRIHGADEAPEGQPHRPRGTRSFSADVYATRAVAKSVSAHLLKALDAAVAGD